MNRDETGREIVRFMETGKAYYVEWIEPRSMDNRGWGDIDPATKKVNGSYGDKYKGSVTESESVITEDNGFKNIVYGKGSPYATIEIMHNKWKAENGFPI